MAANEIMTAARNAFAPSPLDADVDAKLAAAVAAALRSMADIVDRGPTMVPLPPSIISALIREQVDDITADIDG